MLEAIEIAVALAGIIFVGWLIIKKVNAAASLFFVGLLLLLVAAIIGDNAETKLKLAEPSGNIFYDQLLIVEDIFATRFAGVGMAIMILFGFVAYMRHIGADAKAVVLLSAPLKKLHGSYWMVPLGFLLGTALSLVVPSASSLSLLLIATLLPALVAAGMTPLTVGAIVVTSSTIVPTPLEAGLIRGAELVGMPISEYVFSHVAKATIPTLIITAFIHMWWQWRCDKADRAKAMASGSTNVDAAAEATDDALQRAKGLPGFYAILPLLPLLIIIVSSALSRLEITSFEVEILPATVISLLVAVLIEILRHRDVKNSIDSMKNFFVGMGEGAAGVVALIVAAGVFIEGVTQLHMISRLISVTQGSEGAAAIVIVAFVLATAALAILTGSGVAPYNAFAEIVPSLSAETGVLPVRMLNSVWGTSNLMRQVSPVAAAVLIVSGAIKVTPLQLIKRTVVPMVGATILNVLFSFMFISA